MLEHTHTDRSLSLERWGIIIADGEGILLQRFDDSEVACMHIPLRTYLNPEEPSVNTADRADFLRLISGRPAVSFSGHTHTTEHHYLDLDGGSQHHHHVLTAVSGSWWSGPFDHRGIACAMSRDGSPNGYHVLSIDGAAYETRFVAAKEPGGRKTRILLDSVFHRAGRELHRDFRMGQMLGSPISAETLYATEVIVNVFDGGPRTKGAPPRHRDADHRGIGGERRPWCRREGRW